MFSATVIGNTVSDTVVVSTTVIAAVVLNVLLSTLVALRRNRQACRGRYSVVAAAIGRGQPAPR